MELHLSQNQCNDCFAVSKQGNYVACKIAVFVNFGCNVERNHNVPSEHTPCTLSFRSVYLWTESEELSR